MLNNKKIKKNVTETIQKIKVKTPSDSTKIGNLSGGNQQKVILGRWLLTDPEILLLDEPTAGLDPVGVEQILGNIRDYHKAKNATIIIVSHSMEEMARTGEENPRKDAALKTARDIAISRHREITDQLEQEFQYEVVPIRKLVSIQLECGLLVSQALREEKGGDNNG